MNLLMKGQFPRQKKVAKIYFESFTFGELPILMSAVKTVKSGFTDEKLPINQEDHNTQSCKAFPIIFSNFDLIKIP